MSQGASGYRLVEMKIRPGRTTIGLMSSVVLPAANSRRLRKARIGGVASGRQRYSIISDGLPTQLPDIDPDETRDWIDSFDSVTRTRGRGRARYLMLRLLERAREQAVGVPGLRSTDYINTIPPEREPWFPGDEYVERRIRAYIRWNAAIMVSRASASRGSPATSTWSAGSGPISGGTPRSWCPA